MKTNGIVPTGFQPPGEIRLVQTGSISPEFSIRIILERIREVV